jgi:histidine triad (HIT) family protein
VGVSEECIFCRIVAGEAPARVVHETDGATAFLDANPLAPGHTLVVPRPHAGRLADLDAGQSAALFEAVRTLVPRVERAVEADAVTVGINDGAAAGQEVPHVHAHLIPRFEDDGGGPIHGVAGERPDLSADDLDGIATRIAGTE